MTSEGSKHTTLSSFSISFDRKFFHLFLHLISSLEETIFTTISGSWRGFSNKKNKMKSREREQESRHFERKTNEFVWLNPSLPSLPLLLSPGISSSRWRSNFLKNVHSPASHLFFCSGKESWYTPFTSGKEKEKP